MHMYAHSVRTQMLVAVSNLFNTAVHRDAFRGFINAAYRRKYLGEARGVSAESLTSGCENLEITIPMSSWSYGNAPLCDIQAIAMLVKGHRPLNLFEFGTFTGQTSLVLMSNATNDSKLWTLDLPPTSRANTTGINWERDIEADTIGSAFHKHECSSRINQLFDDSLVFDTTPYKNMMDFVYVDACHDYEHCKSDTLKAIEMCRNGALVVWHDVNRGCPDVMRLVGELSKTQSVNYVYNTNIAYMKVCETTK
jgi:predicted O-methyltransferase YrrM